MAILGNVPRLEVRVVDHQREAFKEYDDNETDSDEQSSLKRKECDYGECDDSGEPKAVKYTEPSSGGRFDIQVHVHDNFEMQYDILINLNIDGRQPFGMFLKKDRLDLSYGGTHSVSMHDLSEGDGNKGYSIGLFFSDLYIGQFAFPAGSSLLVVPCW
jgi:hypothetical protein